MRSLIHLGQDRSRQSPRTAGPKRRVCSGIVALLALALLVPCMDAAQKNRPKRKPPENPAPRDINKPMEPEIPTKRAFTMPPPPAPGVLVSARFAPERSVYQNSGRWTAYEDGVYVQPEDGTVYAIGTRKAEAAGPDADAGLMLLAAEIFGTYRRYADRICPSRTAERLQDPAFKDKLEDQYEKARAGNKALFGRELSFEQYLRNVPNCVVEGNLWRTTTRFADLTASAGTQRMLIRFSNEARIRPFLSDGVGEDCVPLLKTRLKEEGRVIRAPLAPKDEPK